MTTSRTFARSAAVIGAATALTFAGTGVAMATSNEHSVDGNSVSVTFTLDSGDFADGDSCGAVLTPTSAAPALASRLSSGNLVDIFNTLMNDKNVIVLYEEGIVIDRPMVVLGEIAGVGKNSGTVTAENVPSNVYALVSVCLSDTSNPDITMPVMVGNTSEALTGSIGMLSSDGDALGTLSSVLGGGGLGEGGLGGDTGSDIGALLGGGPGGTGSAGEGE